MYRRRHGVAALSAALVGSLALAACRPAVAPPGAAAASAPGILVKSVPDKDDTGWLLFDITLPRSAGPLQMQEELIVDGVNQRGLTVTPFWPDGKPRRFRLRISDDFDSRVKEILKAQGITVKPEVVTFTVDTQSSWGGSHQVKTLRFATGRGMWSMLGYPTMGPHKVGEDIILFDMTYYDRSMKAYPKSSPDNDPAWSSHYPGGKAHRLTFQLRFSPETDQRVLERHRR